MKDFARGGEGQVRCVLALRVIPRARRNEISGFMADGRVKVRLTAPPVEGKANHALIIFLARVLMLKKGAISILSGEKGRDKVIAVLGISEIVAKQRINGAIRELSN